MVAPFIVIRAFTIQEGKCERFRQFLAGLFPFIEALIQCLDIRVDKERPL